MMVAAVDNEKWLTITESARFMGISVGYMRSIIRNGRLPPRDVKVVGPTGRTMYYLRSTAVAKFAAENPGGGKGRQRGPLSPAAKPARRRRRAKA